MSSTQTYPCNISLTFTTLTVINGTKVTMFIGGYILCPETHRCTAGIDDTLHVWLCICWLWNKTTSQGYWRFWPTLLSTHYLASMSHTLRVHFTHLTYTELSNNFNSNLHGQPWTQLPLVWHTFSGWLVFKGSQTICNMYLVKWGQQLDSKLHRTTSHDSSLVFRVAINLYAQSGTGGHAWPVYWSVPIETTWIQHWHLSVVYDFSTLQQNWPQSTALCTKGLHSMHIMCTWWLVQRLGCDKM